MGRYRCDLATAYPHQQIIPLTEPILANNDTEAEANDSTEAEAHNSTEAEAEVVMNNTAEANDSTEAEAEVVMNNTAEAHNSTDIMVSAEDTDNLAGVMPEEVMPDMRSWTLLKHMYSFHFTNEMMAKRKVL
ncbi:MAG: hypothetical protein LBG13_02060 [Holosporales bacterium]|nr:hypothetical protein [Holosporales bacterium]